MAARPVLTPNQRGAVAETAIAAHATRLGVEVYSPVVEGGRFDLIFVMPDGALSRVQVKSAARRGGVIIIGCESSRRTSTGFLRRRYTADEIDFVAGYWPEGDRSFLVPASLIAGRSAISLRVDPSLNNQWKGVNWAQQYALDTQIYRMMGVELAGNSPLRLPLQADTIGGDLGL